MASLVRSLILCFLILTASCSVQGAIERFTTPEDRAFAQRFVENVRTGNEEALKPEFDEELWAKSRAELARARPLYPPGKGETKLIGFNLSSDFTNGASSTSKQYVLVTTDNRHWTTTRVATLARDGPARIVEWNVSGSGEPPPELVTYERMERIAPWAQGGLAVLLVAFGLLIFWLVRRSRRRAAAGRT